MPTIARFDLKHDAYLFFARVNFSVTEIDTIGIPLIITHTLRWLTQIGVGKNAAWMIGIVAILGGFPIEIESQISKLITHSLAIFIL